MDNDEYKNIYHQGFIDALTFMNTYKVSCQNIKLPKDDEAIVITLESEQPIPSEELQHIKNTMVDFFKTNRVLIINSTNVNKLEMENKKNILLE